MPATSGDDELERRVGEANVVLRVFDEVPIMLVALEGPEHRIVAANAQYRIFSGRDVEIGRSARELFPDLEGQQIFELLDRVYASGETVTAQEWRLQIERHPTGVPDERYIDVTYSPRRGAEGKVIGVAIHALDVTERVRKRQAAQADAAVATERYLAAIGVVTALQQELMPTALPVLPGARIAARYLVAAHDQAAGGDWFDAVPLADGCVALVVGDVVGHGVAASAAMGQLRAVLEELLTTEPDLETVLARVDAFAARPSLRATTLALAVLDPADGALRYSTCGHPPPLLVGIEGATRFLPVTGAGPLGTGSTAGFAVDVLAPGELILLYSDGLIERPKRTLADGMAELAKVAGDAAANRALPVGAASTPPERVCELTVELLTRSGYADDVTTIAAQRMAVPVPELHVEVSSDLTGLPQVREMLDEWLDRFEPTPESRDGLKLAVWEAVTNAAEHAYLPPRRGSIELDASLGSDGVVSCLVTDRGVWRPPERGLTLRGRGLLLAEQFVDELQVRHPPQDADAPPGAGGTMVLLRKRLTRPAMIASEAGTNTDHRSREPFDIQSNGDRATPLIRVRGPVDVTTADQLALELVAACRGGVLPLSVDLSDVTLLASAGVRALHEVRGQLEAHQHELILLASPNSPAAAVLELVGLASRSGVGDH